MSDDRRVRALLVTRNFPPLRGGMERLNERMFRALHAHDAALVGPAGSSAFVSAGTDVRELPNGFLPLTIAASVAYAVASSRRTLPEVVVAGSGLTAPAALAAARAAGARSAVYLHGLDIIASSHLYQAVWLPCIRRCDRVLVNSANTRGLAIAAGVDAERIRVVHPGTDLPAPDPTARARFRSRLDIEMDVPVLLSVGRLTTRKGLAEFVADALPRVLDAAPRTRLLIIGDQAADALHRGTGAGFGRVREAAERHGCTDAITWLGPCSDAELAEAYQGSDVHVFPVLDMPGDVEGFGMVAIEAAAHGLPTVAFAVGGVPDAVSPGQNGRLVDAHDYRGFVDAVLAMLESPDASAQSEAARRFARGFSWDRFGQQVIAALELRQ